MVVVSIYLAGKRTRIRERRAYVFTEGKGRGGPTSRNMEGGETAETNAKVLV
jgi:hypothetical protein